jgi:hypothetical protein
MCEITIALLVAKGKHQDFINIHLACILKSYSYASENLPSTPSQDMEVKHRRIHNIHSASCKSAFPSISRFAVARRATWSAAAGRPPRDVPTAGTSPGRHPASCRTTGPASWRGGSASWQRFRTATAGRACAASIGGILEAVSPWGFVPNPNRGEHPEYLHRRGL